MQRRITSLFKRKDRETADENFEQSESQAEEAPCQEEEVEATVK